MQPIINTIPGYRAKEYLLVLSPHEELRHRISRTREEFAEKYKPGKAGPGGSQVALARFTQYAMVEERIVHRLRTIAMACPPFKVELKDFGSFPSHTIYINVTSKLPVQNLVREIRREGQSLMTPVATGAKEKIKPHFIMEPHITIAGKLLPGQYEKGWIEYSQKKFTGRFIADALTLLGRMAGEMKYHLIQRFEFQNLPVTTKQGELFSGV